MSPFCLEVIGRGVKFLFRIENLWIQKLFYKEVNLVGSTYVLGLVYPGSGADEHNEALEAIAGFGSQVQRRRAFFGGFRVYRCTMTEQQLYHLILTIFGGQMQSSVSFL